jgi:chaperonin GroEL
LADYYEFLGAFRFSSFHIIFKVWRKERHPMTKLLQFNAQAQHSIKKGVDTLTNAVKGTVGPKGRNVVLDHPLEIPKVLNDGVTIARGIDLEEPFTNMVVQLLKEAAIKTNETVGDGTTTATILVQAILSGGLKSVAAGAGAMLLSKGLECAASVLVEGIRAISRPIETSAEAAQVATIAAGDPAVGELIAGVLDCVGRDGIIMVQEGRSSRTEVEYIKGMQLDRGYISPYMVTNQARMEAVLANPYILITDKKITAISELLPVLELLLARGQKELFVIAEDIADEALTALIVNKNRGIFHVVGIRAPSFGDRRDAMLEDIALLTGGQVISEKIGRTLTGVTLADLGRAGSVTTTKVATIIVDGHGDKDAIRTRMRELHTQLSGTASSYDREKIQERLANFSGGVAVIKVGAATEVELKERKLRIEDALAAVRAALAEGIVPGGGVALVSAQSNLANFKATMLEETMAVNILHRALEEPLRQIATNGGFESSVVVSRVREQPFGYGLDVTSGQYVDMFAAGIVDPARVTITALQNAVGIANMFLTTATLITDKPEYIPDFKDIEFGL